jgi:protein tyrosine phosphatase
MTPCQVSDEIFLSGPMKKQTVGKGIRWMTFGPNEKGRMALWHRPPKSSMPHLSKSGCDVVVSLMGSKEVEPVTEIVKEYNRKLNATREEAAQNPLRPFKDTGNVEHIHFDINHASREYLETPEAASKIIDAVQSLKTLIFQDGKGVLVHCSAGIHRTGTVAYTFLRCVGVTSHEAKNLLTQLRECTGERVNEILHSSEKHGCCRTGIAEKLFVPHVL